MATELPMKLDQLGSIMSRRVREIISAPRYPTSLLPVPRGKLFHYTTADGLKGIIENGELWATSAYFLNDSSEIVYGCSVLKEGLDEWLLQDPARSTSSAQVAQLIRDEIERHLSTSHILHIANVYLACFCEDDNLLSQWRAYGQSGGYSIGFEIPSEGLCRDLRPGDTNFYTARCVKVEYDRKKQRDKCRKILQILLPVADEQSLRDCVAAATGDYHQLALSIVARPIWQVLVDEIVGFKNQAFEVEREWRIVVRALTSFERNNAVGMPSSSGTLVRPLRGALTPYVKLIPAKAKLPISSVRSGPTLDKHAAEMAIRLLLAEHVGHHVRIEGADIPVRF